MLRTIRKTIPKYHGLYSHRCMLYSTNDQGDEVYAEVTQDEGVREICLNHPKTRNSLSLNMMDAIQDALTTNCNDKELRSIVLTAKGKVWSAGHNFKELSSSGPEVFKKMTEIIKSIRKAPIPVIAKVNGLATAAGCQLVASCDILVASENSTFSTPGVNFGIFCSTPGIALARAIPRTQAAYMLITGNPITAHEALIAGLASRVVPESQLDKEIKNITDSIALKSRAVVKLGKEFFYNQLYLQPEQAYELGEKVMIENLGLQDCQEGLKSFMEKRKPHWSHEN